MDSPNIVNVATITGITTYHAGIATVGVVLVSPLLSSTQHPVVRF